MILTPEEANALLSPTFLDLQFVDNEYRIDSRLIAEQLGVEHKATFQQIKKYKAHFEQLGRLPFKMETLETKGGKQNFKYILLNESQSTFCLSLSRNTEKVVDLKLQLTQAFHHYKNQISQIENTELEYKAQKLSLINKAFADATQIAKNAGLKGDLGIIKANELTTNLIGVDIFDLLQMPKPQLASEKKELAEVIDFSDIFLKGLYELLESGQVKDHGNQKEKIFIHMPSAIKEIEKHVDTTFDRNVLYHHLKKDSRYLAQKNAQKSLIFNKLIRAWVFSKKEP